MPSANPLLIPHDILLKLKALPMMEDFDTGSISFRPGFHAERLKFLDVNSPVGPDTIFAGGAGDRLQTQVRHTYLHIACLSGDAPLFCEMIRKGASVDLQDTNGYTGLLLALESLLSCQMALHANSPLSKKASALRSRQEYIARVLIEQHADVNHSVNGLTPLHLVCRAQNWDLIALLLKHGANPTLASSLQGSPSMLLSSSTDRSRFSALVKESPPCNARPARMCPCFSGQPIAACHAANALPYPPSLLCPCASGKSYEKCCARRKMIMVEEWDEKNGCIVASSIRSISLPEMSKHQEKLRDNIEGVMVAKEFSDLLRKIEPGHHYKDLDGESCLKMALRFQEKSTDELLKKGLMDPAYAYALKQLEFSPRPQGRSMSKRDCLECQYKWNAAIDRYISQGGDKRSSYEIEQAAKIGPSNGALYRRCEGKNCDKVEGKNMQKPLFCSGCKMSVYCGSACQTSVWKSHKTICGRDGQHEQALPSQQAFINHTIPRLLKNITAMDLTPPPDVKAFLEAHRQQQH